MPLIPAPRREWAEAEGRRLVTGRAAQNLDEQPCCEATGNTQQLEFSHRLAAGRGGTYAPSNGLLLNHDIHMWAHHHPYAATRLGWHIETGFNPLDAPVWLPRPFPGWWLLGDVDALVTPAHPEDYPPTVNDEGIVTDPGLPTDDELRELLPPAARGALT